MRNWKLPVYATLAYILTGAGWIVAGYFLSGTLYENEPAARFELLKGLAYVGITGVVLFAALSYFDRHFAEDTIAVDLGAAFERSLRRGDLVVRWLPALVIIVFAATIIILALGLWWVREHTLQTGEKSALALQKVHAAQMNSTLDIINFTLREAVRDIAESRLANPSSDLRSRIPDLASSVSSLAVIDASGRVTHNSDANPRAAGLNLSQSDYFLHHLNNPYSGLHVSKPLRDESTGRWQLIASRAIRSADKFMGVVIAVIDPAIFGAYWRQTSAAGSTISIYLADGTLLLHSPYHEGAIGGTGSLVIPSISRGTEDSPLIFRAKSSVDDQSRIHAIGPVAGYPQLRLLVGLSQNRLLESWHAFALISLLVYLLVTGGLSALTFALLRQLRERLFLQRKAAELARYPLQNRNPVLTVTPAGRKLFMNDAARQLFDSVHDSNAAQLDREIRALAATNTSGIREFAIGTRILSASFIPHVPDYCDIYLTDVTSARQDENLLQLFYSLPFIGMAITSPETKHWLRFNDRLCEILGYPRAELEHKSWAELTHPDDLAAEVAESERVMRGETDGYAMDKRFIRPDGAVIDATMDVHAVRRTDRSIEFFVATVQDITERKQSERRLLEQRNLYAALSATNEAIIRIRNRDALFLRVCQIAVEETGIAFAWIGVLNGQGNISAAAARFGEDRGILDRAMADTKPGAPTDCAAANRAIAENRIEVVNHWKDELQLDPWLDLFAVAGFQSLAVLPIRQGGGTIATLHLYSRTAGYFSSEIVDLLEKMGSDLDYAIDSLQVEAERRNAVTELERAEARWQFALEGGEHGVWEWNIPAGTVFYSPRWKTMLGYSPGEISNSIDEWKSRVHPDDWSRVETEVRRYFEGMTPDYSCEHRVRCKDGSYKWILDHGKVTVRDAAGAPLMMIGTHTDVSSQKQAELALAQSEQKFKALVEQSLIGIYMVDEENLIYVNPRAAEIFGYEPEELSNISLANVIVPEDREFVRDNIRRRTSGVIETLRYEFHGLRKDGKIIDVGVHGSRTMLGDRPVVLGVLQDITDKRLHEERVREYVARLERSITSTVQAISHMVDLRDPYTSGHERRVGELAAAIGAEIGLSEHQITGLRIAGDVHDVGKIAVPAEILSKPTRLSAAEFAIVKTHAQQGYEILKDIDFPWPVAQTVWQHHERLDGSGYPRGLRGDEICLEARIMAVADVVESMSTHRPYRPALGPDAAFAELQAKTGTLYDADIVAACVRLFRNKGYTLPE